MSVDNPGCVRCTHTAYHHRLNDASGVGPGDPAALFRCVWPMPDHLPDPPYDPWDPRGCDCPDFVVPADAGWPYNGAAEPAPKPYVVNLATGDLTGGNPGYVQHYDRDTGELRIEPSAEPSVP